MREDQQEALDALFPEGYVMLYATADRTLRMSLYNPHNYAVFPQYMDAMIEHKHDAEGRSTTTVMSQIINQIRSSEPERVRLENIRKIIEGEPIGDAA